MTDGTALSGSLAVLASYLIAGVPFGYLIVRAFGGGDIRTHGSGNIGATNVFRSGGKAAGVATLALDIGKGALAVALARWCTGGQAPWEAAAACAAVLGHCFPVYLRFRGGKGIATGCGAFGLLAPLPMAIALGMFLAVILTTRMVSAGSIAAAVALPVAIVWLQPSRALIVAVAATALLVVARHRANIRRIVSGGEHRIDGA